MDVAAELQTSAGAPSSNGTDTTPSTAPSPANNFLTAVSAWRTLDLSTLLTHLDTAAASVVEHQKESLVQRKDLAQKTKDFRKLEDSAKLVEIKDLLKAYQAYIDVLSTQNKGVQAAFMRAYSPLSEAPDPYPLLEASVEALVTAEEVVPRLEGENERLVRENARLSDALELAEESLGTERTKRVAVEQEMESRVGEVEASWAKVLDEKTENWSAKEKALEEKVDGQDRLLRELKANYEVSQRLEHSSDAQTSTNNSAAQAELDILSSELERTSLRLADTQARNESLRLELAQATTHRPVAVNTPIEEDPSFLRLRSENQSLLRKVDAHRFEKDNQQNSLDTRLRAFEREIAALKVDRESLQAKVQKWSDYDEVKRELEMLRFIEFSSSDDAIDGAAEGNDTEGDASKEESLEHLLIARNKKLNNDLTDLRISHNELMQRLEELQASLSSTTVELEGTRKLNATLENDLQKTQQEASNAFETMSVAGTYTSRWGAAPAKSTAYGSTRRAAPHMNGGGTSPTSSIIGGFEPSVRGDYSPRPGTGTLDSLRAGEAAGGGGGILPMVTAQRDRFRAKISELELELQKQYKSVSGLRSEISSLQRDNLSLYEKSRYTSTYQPPTSPAGGSGKAADRYEASLAMNATTPFASFRGRESARAMKRMSLPERAVLRVMQKVVSTRVGRNLFAGYAMGLHLLVLLLLVGGGGGGSVGAVETRSFTGLEAMGPAGAG